MGVKFYNPLFKLWLIFTHNLENNVVPCAKLTWDNGHPSVGCNQKLVTTWTMELEMFKECMWRQDVLDYFDLQCVYKLATKNFKWNTSNFVPIMFLEGFLNWGLCLDIDFWGKLSCSPLPPKNSRLSPYARIMFLAYSIIIIFACFVLLFCCGEYGALACH